MNLVESDHALRKLRLSGDGRLSSKPLTPRPDREADAGSIVSRSCPTNPPAGTLLLERRHKQAGFRGRTRHSTPLTLISTRRSNRAAPHQLATGRVHLAQREDALFLGPSGTRKEPLGASGCRARSSRVTASSIARRTCCSRSSPPRRSTDNARAYRDSPPFHCSSSMTSGCENSRNRRRRPPRTRHASLRARHDSDVEPSRRGLGHLGDTAAVTALDWLYYGHVLKCGPRAGAQRSTPTCVRTRSQSKTPPVSVALRNGGV